MLRDNVVDIIKNMIAFADSKFGPESKPQIPTEEDLKIILDRYGELSDELNDAVAIYVDQKQKEFDNLEDRDDFYSRVKYHIELTEFFIRLKLYSDAYICYESAWIILNNEEAKNPSDDYSKIAKKLLEIGKFFDEYE